MDGMSAFALGGANSGKEQMVFDWDRAAQLIKDTKPEVASAGLESDWEWTGGEIWRDGKSVPKDETDVYLASTWATPELDMDGVVIPCYKMQSEVPDWDSDTYWPESAKNLIDNK